MRLLGDSAWWLPKWLDRILPEFSIEGKEWFAARDRAANAESGGAHAD
jgi:RND superfamily putative drug exporter